MALTTLHGVTFFSGKHTSTDCNVRKRKVYAGCNCTLSRSFLKIKNKRLKF